MVSLRWNVWAGRDQIVWVDPRRRSDRAAGPTAPLPTRITMECDRNGLAVELRRGGRCWGSASLLFDQGAEFSRPRLEFLEKPQGNSIPKGFDHAFEVPDLIRSACAKAVEVANALRTHIAHEGVEIVALVARCHEQAARISTGEMFDIASLAILPGRLAAQRFIFLRVRTIEHHLEDAGSELLAYGSVSARSLFG